MLWEPAGRCGSLFTATLAYAVAVLPQYAAPEVNSTCIYCQGTTFPSAAIDIGFNSSPAMQRALFTEEEVRLATERRLKYLGTAKVSINQIQFDPPLPRDLDPKNLDRLREIFRKNRCRRLNVDNHVPAIVSQQDLALALQKANVPRRSLLTNDPQQFPQLGFAVGHSAGTHWD